MGNIKSVSFKNSENDIYNYAMKQERFSEYIKKLIRLDKDKTENLFTKEEREEIEKIVHKAISGGEHK